MAPHVFLCRHHGTWHVTGCRDCRSNGVALWMGVAFIAGLLVAILWVLHDPRLPNDALLALCSATLLCSGLMFIQHIPSLRPELLSYLFGDLLQISWSDLPVFCTGDHCRFSGTVYKLESSNSDCD